MARILSTKDIHYILYNDASSPMEYYGNVASKAKEKYKPLFFKPYKQVDEFVIEQAYSVIEPITAFGIGCYALIAAIGTTTASIFAYAAAGIAYMTMANTCASTMLNIAEGALTLTISALATAMVSLAVLLISIPHSVLSLMTRTGATLSQAIHPSTVKINDEGPSLGY